MGGDQNIVLDANTAPFRKVDPRLDGDHHTRLQDGLGLLAETGASWISMPSPWPVPWSKK